MTAYDNSPVNPQDNPTESFDLPSEAPGIIPLLPMLYIAWADGIFSPEEFDVICQRLQEKSWFNKTEKVLLAHWLNPDKPPTPRQLQNWLQLIRQTARNIPESFRHNLAAFGMEIARIGASDAYERCSTPEVCAALAEVEEALGIVSTEAINDLLSPAPPTKQSPLLPPADFNVAVLQQLLDGEYAPVRNRVKAILSQPHFRYRYGLDKQAYRELVLEWAQELAAEGIGSLSYPEAYGGKEDLGAFIAAFETLAFHDLSLLTKFGVQFGLFGGAILNLSLIHI